MRLGFGIGVSSGLTRRPMGAPSGWPAGLFMGGETGFLYDPSSPGTLFQDAAASVPVTAAGQPVGCVLDLSGQSNHATQTAAAARPTYQTDGTSHWLEFDGIDDHLTTATVAWGSSAISFATGIRKLSTARATIFDGAGAPRVTLEGPGPSGGDFSAFLWSTLSVNASARVIAAPPVSAVLAGLYDMTSLSVRLTLNEAETSTGTAVSGSGDFGAGAINIGRRTGSAQYFHGRLYGGVLLSRAMSSAEEALATAWLNARTNAF